MFLPLVAPKMAHGPHHKNHHYQHPACMVSDMVVQSLWILVAASLLIAAIIYLLRRKEERMQADLQAHKQKFIKKKYVF